jgi:hypothetical protein
MVFDNRLMSEMDNDKGGNAQTTSVSAEADIIPTTDDHVEINSEADMREAFSNIREEVDKSGMSADLIMLYREAGGLIKLLESPPFQERVGAQLDDIRRAAEEEFAQTARELNKRAPEINSTSHFAEKWGD